jgi:hypothetical protein
VLVGVIVGVDVGAGVDGIGTHWNFLSSLQ